MWGLNWRSRIGWSKHPHTFFLLIIATILYLASLFFWVTRVTGNLEERVEVPFEKDLSEVVDDYCRNLDQRFYTETNPESESTLTRAKRAKLIRDSLIFFPDLGQMWCLVPKVCKPIKTSFLGSATIIKWNRWNFITGSKYFLE